MDTPISPEAVISRLSTQIAGLVTQLAMKDAALEDVLARLAKYEDGGPGSENTGKVSFGNDVLLDSSNSVDAKVP